MSHPALATLWSPCRAFRHKAVYLPPFRSIQCCNSVLRRLPVARCCHVASVEPVQDVLPQSRLPRERCLVALIQPLLKRLWLFLGCAVAALVALLASPPTSHAQYGSSAHNRTVFVPHMIPVLPPKKYCASFYTSSLLEVEFCWAVPEQRSQITAGMTGPFRQGLQQ